MSQNIRQLRTYDAEFKRDAVLLVVEKGRSCADVAEALGIPVGTLYNWIELYKKHRVDPFPEKGKLHAVDEELCGESCCMAFAGKLSKFEVEIDERTLLGDQEYAELREKIISAFQ